MNFLVIALLCVSGYNSLEWDYKSLVDYAKNNQNIVNPKGGNFLFVDPDFYISDETQRETIINYLSSINNKYHFNIVLIIIQSMLPLYGYEANLKQFAANFSVGYYNDISLRDCMTIAFSINENKKNIIRGVNVEKNFNASMCDSYLYNISLLISEEKYYEAFEALLNDIDNKRIYEYNDEDNSLSGGVIWAISFSIVVGICLVVSLIIYLKSRYDSHNVLKQDMTTIFMKILNKKNKKEIINDYCLYCLKPMQIVNTIENVAKTELDEVNPIKETKEEQVFVIKENYNNTNGPLMKDESVQSTIYGIDNSNQIGKCQHYTHNECNKLFIKEFGIICPLCSNGFNYLEETKEGKQKLCEMIFVIQKKINKCDLCCTSITELTEIKN